MPGAAGAVLVLAVLGAFAWPAGSGRAQSLLDRPPATGGAWAGRPGNLYFEFLHHFRVSDPPARKVSNSPTITLAGALPGRTLAGFRYASSSRVYPGVPNEWEFFGRWHPVAQARGRPVDAAVLAAYNTAARSLDGELTVARRWGPLRMLASGRALGDAYGRGETRGAAAGGVVVDVVRHVAVGADVATLLDRGTDEDVAWSAGLLLEIPYTPHTLSLHASNANTITLQGASRGGPSTRYGFAFSAPIDLARYFGARAAGGGGGGAGGGGGTDASPAAGPGDTVTVGMTDRMSYAPERLTVTLGATVRWENTSDLVHTVTADSASAIDPANVVRPAGAPPFDSGNLLPGRTFTWTPPVAGEYRYLCVPHQADGMFGAVVVLPAGGKEEAP